MVDAATQRADLEAIRRRWSPAYDRGAHDYTDEGCRVLAEHAFKDISVLAAELERLRAIETAADSFEQAISRGESAWEEQKALRRALASRAEADE